MATLEIRDLHTDRVIVRIDSIPYLGNVAFAPDGKELVTGGWDGILRVWDVASGKESRRFDHSSNETSQLSCLEIRET